MITSCAWVARGRARETPLRSLDQPVSEELQQRAAAFAEQAAEMEAEAAAALEGRDVADGMSGEESGDGLEDVPEDGTGMMFASNAEDPYMTAPEEADRGEDGEEDDDMLLSDADAMLLACAVDEGESNLEVHIYNEETGSFYVHHDVPLSAFPLCIETLDFQPGSLGAPDGSGDYVGNFAAIGTFEPEIEIINLDVSDAIEPAAVLGTEEHGHTDAVMGLAWNREHRNLLASASADCTVRLWDLSTEQCRLTMRHHSDKVQSLAWHPREAVVLATASFDRSASVIDVRASETGVRFPLPADAESLTWNPHVPDQFVVSLDSGAVLCFDVRRGGEAPPVFHLQAHAEAASTVTFSPGVPGLMATSSTDGAVKLWDIAATVVDGTAPELVASKALAIGRIFCSQFWANAPFLLASGGDRSECTVAIWEVSENDAVRERFGSRVIEDVRHLGLDALRSGDEGGDERSDASAALAASAAAAAAAASAPSPPPSGKKKKKGKKKR